MIIALATLYLSLYFLVRMFLGHMVGDYILQTQWMAEGKSCPGIRGNAACTVHVALYTLAIALFIGVWSPLFLAAVAIPHWIIDRWSLAKHWLNFKNQGEEWMKSPFAPLIYAANDNTFHFLCLWWTLRIFGL
jgi:hypothetical protein